MDDQDIDRQIKALLAEAPPRRDPVFAERIVALAAYDAQLRRVKKRKWAQLSGEMAALAAILATFALTARLPSGDLAGFGDTIAFASPAMVGVALLALWTLVVTRDPASA